MKKGNAVYEREGHVQQALTRVFLVQVYLGAPNIDKYAPAPNSFVNAHTFAGPEELAAYLGELDRNATLYDSYFTWR